MAAPCFVGQLRRRNRWPLTIRRASTFIAAVLLPGNVAKAADEQPPEDVRNDLETFEAVYSLGDGDLLARIAPPFIPERMVYYRAKHAFQAQAIPRGPDTILFRWNEKKLQQHGMSFGGGKGIQLRSLLRMLAEIYPQEVEGDQQLLDTDVSGDFVLRVGQPTMR
jgi:hypothetical protein